MYIDSVSNLSDLEDCDHNKQIYVISEKFIYYWDGAVWAKVIICPQSVGSLKNS